MPTNRYTRYAKFKYETGVSEYKRSEFTNFIKRRARKMVDRSNVVRTKQTRGRLEGVEFRFIFGIVRVSVDR